jgi:ankyrin repeat protein
MSFFDGCSNNDIHFCNEFIAKSDNDCEVFMNLCSTNFDYKCLINDDFSSFMKNSYNEFMLRQWNKGLLNACSSGNIDIAKLMISKGSNNFVDGLKHACSSGHVEIAKLMISSNKDIVSEDFNRAFEIACSKNQVEIVNFLLTYLEDSCECEYDCECCYGRGFEEACYNDHIEIVKILLAFLKTNNFVRFFSIAIKSGHIDIISLMLDQENININNILCDPEITYTLYDDYNDKIKAIQIIELFISKGYNEFDYGLCSACRYNNIEIANFMISKGANNWDKALSKLNEICYYNSRLYDVDNYKTHFQIVKLIVSKNPTNCYEMLDSNIRSKQNYLYTCLLYDKCSKEEKKKLILRHGGYFSSLNKINETLILSVLPLLEDISRIVCDYLKF